MKEWLKTKMKKEMKNEIVFIILDKFFVKFGFSEKLQLLRICSNTELSNINFDKMFDFAEMSNDELVEYINNFSKLSQHSKTMEIGNERFELSNIDYSYSYSDNKLQFDSELIYKSPTKLFGGTGEFSVNLHTVFNVLGKSLDGLTVHECSISINIANETINIENPQATSIISYLVTADFNDSDCNDQLPDNIQIISNGNKATTISNIQLP